MEIKWLAIGGIGIFAAMFGSLAISESAKYNKQAKCLASYAMSNRSAQEIETICKEAVDNTIQTANIHEQKLNKD